MADGCGCGRAVSFMKSNIRAFSAALVILSLGQALVTAGTCGVTPFNEREINYTHLGGWINTSFYFNIRPHMHRTKLNCKNCAGFLPE